MVNFKSNTVLSVIAILGLVFIFTLVISMQGWGYAGHRGRYHRIPRFYHGEGDYYPDKNNRPGTERGNTNQGGGPHGGK